MKIKQIVAALLGSLLILLSASGLTAFAETSLPDGAVKGLPERLAALDDEGNHVNSESGEYFFHVENMKFGETYIDGAVYSRKLEVEKGPLTICGALYTHMVLNANPRNTETMYFHKAVASGGRIELYDQGKKYFGADVNGKHVTLKNAVAHISSCQVSNSFICDERRFYPIPVLKRVWFAIP